MGKAACAAAGEHEADAAPGQEAGDPADVGCIDDMVMLNHRGALQPAGGGTSDDAFIVQQRELDARAAGERGFCNARRP